MSLKMKEEKYLVMLTRCRPEMFFFSERKLGQQERLLGIPRLEEEEAKLEDRKFEQETNFLL